MIHTPNDNHASINCIQYTLTHQIIKKYMETCLISILIACHEITDNQNSFDSRVKKLGHLPASSAYTPSLLVAQRSFQCCKNGSFKHRMTSISKKNNSA